MQAGVHIKVLDFNKSLEFYLAFNFQPVFVYGNAQLLSRFKHIPHAFEEYNGITFEVNSMLLEIADGHIAINPSVFKEKVTSSKVSLMIDTQSVSTIREICELNNFDIAKQETNYHWGKREIIVRDPDGVILVFREDIK